jgi:glucose/arabinose dehydrogenase
VVALLVAVMLPHVAQAAPNWPTLVLVQVAEGLQNPLHLTHAGDGSDRLFVVERAGRIRIIQQGTVLSTPFLDITDRVTSPTKTCNECGLLSIAFPPDYAEAGYFFVYYTSNEDLIGPETGDPNGEYDTVVARFRVTDDPNVIDRNTEQRILLQNQPRENHNGGQLAFDADGDLYIGLGDGGGGGDPHNNAQDPLSLLGKLLRVQVGATGTYTVPADNPFVGNTAFRPEIWALGLRNPWRFAFDPITDDLYIGDVGQNDYEEINFQPADSSGGENYGWPRREGKHCYRDPCDPTGLVEPVTEYGHDIGGSVTGGKVYRSDATGQVPVYLYADFTSGIIFGLQQDAGEWRDQQLLDTDHLISSFGEDEAGALYLTAFGSGRVYRLMNPRYNLLLPTLMTGDGGAADLD